MQSHLPCPSTPSHLYSAPSLLYSGFFIVSGATWNWFWQLATLRAASNCLLCKFPFAYVSRVDFADNSMYNWPGHSLELGFGLGFGIEFSSRIQAECRKTATTFLCYAAVCSVASRPLVSSNFAVIGVSFESQTKENKKDTCSHTLPCLFHLSLFLICAFCSLPASWAWREALHLPLSPISDLSKWANCNVSRCSAQ